MAEKITQNKTPNINIKASRGWCLAYVDNTINAPKRTANAEIAFNNEKQAKRIKTTQLPEGVWVPVFFGLTTGVYKGLGHVAIARRTGSKIAIHDSETASGARNPYGSLDELMAWFGAYKPVYRGWSTQCDGGVFAKVEKVVPKKSVDAVAKEIADGKGGWGNYPTRKTRLEKAGYNYAVVQAKVNQLVAAKAAKPKKKSNEEVALEIFTGKGGWGNNPLRAARLAKAGYNPLAVQTIVNRLMRK